MGERRENRGPQATNARTASVSEKGTGFYSSAKPPYDILQVCPTKKAGAILATATVVLFGQLRVMFKLVRGPHGLFLGMPAGRFRGRNGKPRYRSWVKFEDPDLRDLLQEDVIDVYRQRLARDGRNPPEPTEPKPKPRDRVCEALEAAAESVDAPEVCASLLERLIGIVGDPAASPRDVVNAAKVLVKIVGIQTDRLGHYTRAWPAGLVKP